MAKLAKPKKLSLERKLSRCGYVFILPLIFGVFMIWLPNIVQAMVFTLNELTVKPGSYELEWMGFEYFRQALFENAEFIPMLLSSLQSLVADIPVILIFSLFMAVMLNQEFHGRTFVRAVFFIPVVLVTGVVANTAYETGLSDIMASQNLGDTASQTARLTAEIESLLLSLNFGEGLLGIVSAAVTGISDVVQSSGVQIFLFLAALQEIPESLYEAARVEGCTKWETFWKITLPMLAPQILVVAIYTLVDIFSQSDSPLFKYLDSLAFAQQQYSYASAMYWLYTAAVGIGIAVVGLIIARATHRRVEGGR